jgi:hypothetical protein
MFVERNCRNEWLDGDPVARQVRQPTRFEPPRSTGSIGGGG